MSERNMKTENVENKYMPEISKKEADEMRNSMKAASEKIMAENIERMKKAGAAVAEKK